MKSHNESRHLAKLCMLTALALVCCVGGVIYAVKWGVAGDATRGGVLGIAVTFFMLFVARPVPDRLLREPVMDSEEHSDQITRISYLRTALAAQLDIQNKETWFLGIASIVSTIMSGFGDLIALWFGATV